MIRSTRSATAVAVALLAAGCANTTFHVPFFGGEEEAKAPEYAQARKSIQNRPLEVPPDLSAPEANGTYNIPGLNGAAINAAGQKALENGTVLPKLDRVRLESAGSQRWLVVEAPAEKVWPQARQFWLDQGYKLIIDNPVAGILETNWEEERPDLPVGGIRAALQRGLGTLYSTGKVNQYRMRLERGSDANTTEIYISHRGMEENYVGANREDTRWTVSPTDPEREATQLKKLLVSIGVSADSATKVAEVSKPAAAGDKPASSAGTDRAELITLPDGKRSVRINESFDRAWRRVGLALERAGYSINDRDRSLGVYYVKPGVVQKAKEEGGGFWSKLAFWKSEEKKTTELDGSEYLVGVVGGKDGHSLINVGARNGSALPEPVSKTLFESLLVELR